MPLFKSGSKKAFDKNVSVEMDAGKPQKQSLAIAYEIKKKNSPKKMAKGGPVSAADEMEAKADNAKDDTDEMMLHDASTEHDTDQDLRVEPKATADSGQMMMADGGMVDSKSITPEEMMMIRGHRLAHGDEAEAGSMRADADNAKDDRDLDMYADGGEVGEDGANDLVESILSRRRALKQGQSDLGSNADEDLNHEDDLSFEAGHDKQDYSEDAALKELSGPSAGNLKGHDAEDEHDESLVDSIRARLKAKRGM